MKFDHIDPLNITCSCSMFWAETVEQLSTNLIPYIQTLIISSCSPKIMLHPKKQFEPLLSAISEVLQPQNLVIIKPTKCVGYIKKEKSFNSEWKNKTFCFLFVPFEKLTCQIYNQKGSKLQEKIDLSVARLTKKCTEVDNRICFGLVTPQEQKYLIALKSNRQCLNIFFNLSSAKKILKSSMFKTQLQSSQEQILNSSLENQQQVKVPLKKLSTKMQDQLQNSQQYQKSSMKSTKEYLLKPFKLLQNLKGYQLIKEFSHGNIYQNKQKAVKITMVIPSVQQALTILQHIWQLDMWNSKVRKYSKISSMQNGKHKFYLQFHKQGCFSTNKCCQVIVSLLEIDQIYYMSISSVPVRPQYISAQKWVNINVSALIKTRACNPKEKEMFISLESSNHGHLMRQFGNQVQNFREYLQCKVNGDKRQLQIRKIE